jgi:uncharacterized membrane protein YedE/YeeE
MRKIVALVSGLVFGAGLTLSDMINPARVRGFLDMFGGAWDPTLAFVMGGAMVVMIAAWLVVSMRAKSLLGHNMPGAPSGNVDARLVGGAAVFGLGWGLVGVCPGPAISGLFLGGWPILVFIAAMVAGMMGFSLVQKRA